VPIINGEGYISNPNNSYASHSSSGNPYNTITFESLNKKEF